MNKRKSKGKERDVIKKTKTNSSIFTYEIYPTEKLKVGFEISYARGYAYVSKCRKNTKVKKGDIIKKINDITFHKLDVTQFNYLVIYLDNLCFQASLFRKKYRNSIKFVFERNEYSLLPQIDIENIIENIHSSINPPSKKDYIKKMEIEISKAEKYAFEHNSEMLDKTLKEARKYASLAEINIELRLSKIPKISVEENHSYYLKEMNKFIDKAKNNAQQLDFIKMDKNLELARKYATLANDLKWKNNRY